MLYIFCKQNIYSIYNAEEADFKRKSERKSSKHTQRTPLFGYPGRDFSEKVDARIQILSLSLFLSSSPGGFNNPKTVYTVYIHIYYYVHCTVTVVSLQKGGRSAGQSLKILNTPTIVLILD
jgi:hypothetical protein